MKPAKRPPRRGPAARSALAFALAATAAAGLAGAQDPAPSPVILRAGVSTTHDSNVFRLPDEVDEPVLAGGGGRSDRILSAFAGAKLETTMSQQRFVAELTGHFHRYDRFTDLDRDALDYRAAWDWRLTSFLGGTVSTERAESLLGFDLTQRRRPTENVKRTSAATFDAWPGGGWHMLGGVSTRESTNTPGFLPQPDYRENVREAGTRYQSSSQNAVTATWRRADGHYDNVELQPGEFGSGGYRSDEKELQVAWVPAEKSALFGRYTRVDRRHDEQPFRDFSGNAGEIAWKWSPAGRVEVTLAVQRSLAPWFNLLSASYRVDDTYSVAPAWQVTNKVKLRLFAYRTATEFLGDLGQPEDASRRDTMRGLLLAAEWSPHRTVTVSASVQKDKRTSTDAPSRFSDVVGGLNVAVSLRDFK